MTVTIRSGHTDASGARRIDPLLAHYGNNHKNRRNEVIHFIAIPLIALSLPACSLYALHSCVAMPFWRPEWCITPGCQGFFSPAWPCKAYATIFTAA